MKRMRSLFLSTILVFIGLCLFLLAAIAVSNTRLPRGSSVVGTLSPADKIRLAEYVHLRQSVGEYVWPGWGQAGIPAIVYNESYAFLVGYPEPPDGWVKVPAGIQRGGPWEGVSGEAFDGQPYYRQAMTGKDSTPESFTVMVGERWVSSLQTYDWMAISLTQTIRQDLPAIFRPVFPYRLFISQLLGGSDKYISLIAHESFHAYQGMLAPEKLAGAEHAARLYEDLYPWEVETVQAGWDSEMDILAEALRSTDQERTLELARRFLAARAARRASANFSAELVAYEQQREWLEGLARYAELEIWRRAYAGEYTPIPEASALRDFAAYSAFDTRWDQELGQFSKAARDPGDGRFYYSGMAQAALLDRLAPGWKQVGFDDGVWLDELLEDAVQNK